MAVVGVQIVGSESPKFVPLTVWFVRQLKGFVPETRRIRRET